MAADPPIPAEAITPQLNRILASKGLANAGRLSRLLRYVVERTLAGEADQLKEYAVGVEVFDRDDKYDPRLDSIVRVEAGRLRSRLEEYYSGEGAQDEVRILLPRGGYSAQFGRRSEPVTPPIVVAACRSPVRERESARPTPARATASSTPGGAALGDRGWRLTSSPSPAARDARERERSSRAVIIFRCLPRLPGSAPS